MSCDFDDLGLIVNDNTDWSKVISAGPCSENGDYVDLSPERLAELQAALESPNYAMLVTDIQQQLCESQSNDSISTKGVGSCPETNQQQLEHAVRLVQRRLRQRRADRQRKFQQVIAYFETPISTSSENTQVPALLLLQGQKERQAATLITAWRRWHLARRQWQSLKRIVNSIKFAYRFRRYMHKVRHACRVLQSLARRIHAQNVTQSLRIERALTLEKLKDISLSFSEDPRSHLMTHEQLMAMQNSITVRTLAFVEAQLKLRQTCVNLEIDTIHQLMAIETAEKLKAKIEMLQSETEAKKAHFANQTALRQQARANSAHKRKPLAVIQDTTSYAYTTNGSSSNVQETLTPLIDVTGLTKKRVTWSDGSLCNVHHYDSNETPDILATKYAQSQQLEAGLADSRSNDENAMVSVNPSEPFATPVKVARRRSLSSPSVIKSCLRSPGVVYHGSTGMQLVVALKRK